jgi:hypothetical protein
LWLEWDLAPGQMPGASGPSLFLAPPAGPPPPDSYFTHALTLLGAGASAPALAKALGALPRSIGLRQLGVMLPRPVPVVRLVLDTGTRAAAEAVVDTLCPQNRAALSALFALPGFSSAPRLDLDLTPDGIGPRLSLELPSLTLPGPALADCLAGLVAQGVIDAGAARDLKPLTAWRRHGMAGTFGLSHLKASAEAGTAKATEVKAYIGLVATPALVPA